MRRFEETGRRCFCLIFLVKKMEGVFRQRGLWLIFRVEADIIGGDFSDFVKEN